MDWQVGNFALCITPGSKLENRVVMVISKPLEHPDKPDVVYWVHPGFPDGGNWGWGAEKRHLRPVPDWIEPIEWERFHRTVEEEFYEIADLTPYDDSTGKVRAHGHCCVTEKFSVFVSMALLLASG